MNCDHNKSLGRLIYLTAQDMKNHAEKSLKPYDLTLEQFHLLKHMSPDAAISQRELGELVNKTPANITRILDRLAAKNLVVRRNNPEDRRSSQVVLTERGLALVREVFTIFESFSAQLTHGITEQEQQNIIAALNRIGQNIKMLSPKIQPLL
jgi:DNA-binding MarR family transcriptional regulator